VAASDGVTPRSDARQRVLETRLPEALAKNSTSWGDWCGCD
jgi:hypothetical protein